MPGTWEVLHEDADLVALDKPAGRLVIPGRGPAEPTLQEEAERRFGRLWVVHRLDRGTSGVLVFARSAAAHRSLNLAFEGREVEKRYLALVRGHPPPEARLTVALAPGRRGRTRAAEPSDPRGKAAVTLVRRLETFEGGGRAAGGGAGGGAAGDGPHPSATGAPRLGGHAAPGGPALRRRRRSPAGGGAGAARR